ncbi:MAG: ABC transporter permease, partial [candidate division NC10 bacterium]
MLTIVYRRLLALVPVLFGVSLLVFSLTAVSLGDPARAAMGQRGDPEVVKQIRAEYALDRPL